MCELLGINTNIPVRPVNVLASFYQRGEFNPDGVGIAYYTPDRKSVIRKQAQSAMHSPLAKSVLESGETCSSMFIAHVRLASPGLDISYNNTHPFGNELNGKDYIFAHNGSLRGSRKFPLGAFRPKGETDSEYTFSYILSVISANIKLWDNSAFELLHGVIKEINREGTFNMMMSDGEYLFCYQDKKSHNGGLVYAERRGSEKQQIESSDSNAAGGEGYIISTRPVTKDKIRNFSPGELKVFQNGSMIYSSADKGGSYASV